jgi:hypothetical protein
MHLEPRTPRQAPLGATCLLAMAAIVTSGPFVLAAPGAPGSERAPVAPQVARDRWKDCAFNDVTIGCIDQPVANGIRVVWKDGLAMTYREQPARKPGDSVLLRDQLGGLWRRQVLAQGNIVLTNVSSGARIFVPLRFPCKPPLKGEVGYCHY